MNSKIIFLGLAGAMSLMLASCSGEEADEILKGDAISFNTSVSRANVRVPQMYLPCLRLIIGRREFRRSVFGLTLHITALTQPKC